VQVQLHAKIPKRILAAEVRAEHCARPVGHAHLTQNGVARRAHLGMRAREKKRMAGTPTIEIRPGLTLSEQSVVGEFHSAKIVTSITHSFPKVGSRLTAGNVRLFCARCNLQNPVDEISDFEGKIASAAERVWKPASFKSDKILTIAPWKFAGAETVPHVDKLC
jgi:hypothetical protein